MLGGYINAREWRIWEQGGARPEKQCRFGGGMLRMWNVGFGMGHAAREYFSHGSRRSTQKPFGVLVNNTDRAAGAADRRRSFRRWRGIYNVECGECGMWSVVRVPLDVEWVYNGEHGAKRLCLYGAKSDNGIKKCAPMGRLERKKSYLCCKKRRTDHRAAR